ncbi:MULTISPECIES: methylase [unclassified Lactococcus]|uniref:methylase n=1 Tax=unclassified Lactococcus TaxID=2643510 RepID=UPI0011CC4C34|nr:MULTISPECIES: methylase [unclassified Lactococcus]MQW22403.1 methylase [Lactococcus sp. dk101]TXK45438.1 methylase [Lactococcus sp. dk310]TXK51771.1 methylase [Lactococcus sp. dk322]
MYDEKLIKSKARVQQHGEVFTPHWMVQKMLDVPEIKKSCEDIEATFLEPSAGDGNFLLAILERKLDAVTTQFNKRYWESKSLIALSSIYGIEFLEDNLELARYRMRIFYLDWYEQKNGEKLNPANKIYKSAKFIIDKNIVRGNTLTKKHPEYDEWIEFYEWKKVYGSSSKVEPIKFTFASLFNEEAEVGVVDGQMSFDFLFDDEPQAKQIEVIDIKEAYKLGEL